MVNNLQSNTSSSEIIEFTKEEEKIIHLQKELLFGKFGFHKNSLCIQNLLFYLSISFKHIIWPISSQFAWIHFSSKSFLMIHLWYHGGKKTDLGHFGKWNVHKCGHSVFQNGPWVLTLSKWSSIYNTNLCQISTFGLM